MSEHTHHEVRVATLETKMDALTDNVVKLTKAVETIASRPSTIAWREIAITAGAFLMLFAYIGNYLEGQHAKNVAVDKYRISQLEQQMALIAPFVGFAMAPRKQ
jgi:hypothetical protein